MEFLTIHELSRLTGVSTATIRLDIKAGKLPVAAPGKKGRGNPTRIRVADLERAGRILYQELARQLHNYGENAHELFEKDPGKLSVNELAVRTGLSPQVIRKDIMDGKLRAGGGGRRGSPYYILLEDLVHSQRFEYQRLMESSTQDVRLETVQAELDQLKRDMEQIKRWMQSVSDFSYAHSSESSANNRLDVVTVQVALEQIRLPSIYQDYYVSEDKLKAIKDKILQQRPMPPIYLRKLEDGNYQLRKGMAEYHVAKEMGLSVVAAVIENQAE